MNTPENSISLHQITKSALAAEFSLSVPQLVAKLSAGGLDLGTAATFTKEQEAIARQILTTPDSPKALPTKGNSPTDQRKSGENTAENSTEKHLTAEQVAADWGVKPETIEHWGTIAKRAFSLPTDSMTGPFSPDEVALIEDVRAHVIGGLSSDGLTPAEYVQQRQAFLSTLDDQVKELEADRLQAEERQALAAMGEYFSGTADQFFTQLDNLQNSTADEVAEQAANQLEGDRFQRLVYLKTALKLRERQQLRAVQKPQPISLLAKATLMIRAAVQPPALTAAEAVKLLTGTPPITPHP